MSTPENHTDPTPRPAHASAAARDWPGYFAATAGRPPRETLLAALDRFEGEGIPPDDGERPLAVDLGCGEGRDTAEMLRRGWRVVAIDGHPEAFDRMEARADITHRNRLEMREYTFEEAAIPECTLLNASFSLPFCAPERFDALWKIICWAIVPGGRFAGQLFGDRDSWAKLPDRSHQTREEAERLLAPFTVEEFREEERAGEDCTGAKKHWHVFHIIARKA